MRTDASARRQNRNDARRHVQSAATKAFLQIRVEDTPCCIDANQVSRVLPLMELRRVPQAADHVRGMFFYSGEPIFVIDLIERLGRCNLSQYGLGTPVLLCRTGEGMRAMIVSDVLGLIRVDPEAVTRAVEFETAMAPFSGTVKTERGLSLILDVERALQIDLSRLDTDLDVDPRTLLSAAAEEVSARRERTGEQIGDA